MKIILPVLFLTLSAVAAHSSSLGWYLLPENIEDLPLEISSDNQGQWNEIWLREKDKEQGPPRSIMEQAVGVQWIGMEPDKSGHPKRLILVYAEKNIIDIKGDGIASGNKTRTGKLDVLNGKILWDDGSIEKFIGNKKRRRRGRHNKAINFGKINLPPLTKVKELPPESFDQLDTFISKISDAPGGIWKVSDLAVVYSLFDPKTTLLKFRFSPDCSRQDRLQIQSLIAQTIEPKLTCWMTQNPDRAMRLVATLMQRPFIDCRVKAPDVCGEANLPLTESFFVTAPKISLNVSQCQDELGVDLLHESLHLAGLADGPELDLGIEQAESCMSAPAELIFDGNSEEFYNDLQVETRMGLFRHVRDEAVDKWGWREVDRDFVLGQICSKMGDKFCSRRFFSQASEDSMGGIIPLPEGGEVSLKAASLFGLYDSISEDLPRMHELARYLSHDPNGLLLRRLETDTHHLHEFFVARNTLEKIKERKGICNSETDEKVYCEDLAIIAKSPWFSGTSGH